MTAYRYRAARSDGALLSGVIEAASAAAAALKLEGRGLLPVEVTANPVRPVAKRAVARAQLAVVFRSLASLVAHGVPLTRAVEATLPLARGPLHTSLRGTLRELGEGRSLAAALRAQDVAVPETTLGIVASGERAGRLSAALEEAATQLAREADLSSRLRQALAYPAVLMVTGIASLAVIGLVVVPRFSALLADLGQELPTSTRVLLGVSMTLQRWAPVLVVALVVTGVALQRWTRTGPGRLQLHELLLGMPVLGPIRHGLAASRFGQAMGGLLATGTPMLAALEVAGQGLGDAAVAARAARAQEWVAEGRPLTRSLEQSHALPLAALQLIAVGEASGDLAAMARQAGELAGRDAERQLQTAVALIEPAIILTFGGGVALVAVALFQAVYAIRPV